MPKHADVNENSSHARAAMLFKCMPKSYVEYATPNLFLHAHDFFYCYLVTGYGKAEEVFRLDFRLFAFMAKDSTTCVSTLIFMLALAPSECKMNYKNEPNTYSHSAQMVDQSVPYP